MKSWNLACRAVAMITVSMIGLSGCGGGSANSGAVSTTVPTVQPTPVPAVQPTVSALGAPAGVSAVGGTNKVTVSWNAVSGATSYTIYWSASTGVTTATGTGIASPYAGYIHRGLLPATTYYYVVTARNDSSESGASGQVSAATATLDGAVPYTINCASCHGLLATSTVTNKDVTDIKAALQDINNMNGLTLTDAQIAAISAALMYNQ